MQTIKTSVGIFLRLALLLGIALLAFAGRARAQWPTWAADCTNNAVPNSVVGGITWKPAACQEFNEAPAQAMDANKVAWAYDTCTAPCGEGNNEIEQYCPPPGYTGGVPAGCPTTFSATTNTEYVDGSGHLIIQAINNGVNNSGTWFSARVKSEQIENFKYGRIEASVQLPDTTNEGLWPAWWSLGTSIDQGVSWPTCGESDFMEVWSPSVNNGPGTGKNKSTIHTAVTGGSGLQPNGTFTFPGGQANDTAFHQYGIIWSANMMQFYVDNAAQPFYIVTTSDLSANDVWPFNAQIFVLLNMAVGGTLGGTPGASTPNPAVEMVDYVRQYTATVPAPNLGTPPSITVTAGEGAPANMSTFTPTGTGYLYLTCTTNAPKASCALTTNTTNSHVFNLGAAGSLTVTANTTSNAWLPRLLDPRMWNRPVQIGVPALLTFLILLLSLRRARVSPGFGYGLALGSLVLVAVAIAGCNSGGTSGGGGGGTTPGLWSITLNAFDEGNTTGVADATTNIALTVN